MTWLLTLALAGTLWTVADVLAALEEATPRAACIVRYETGGRYDPYAIGDQGELGVAQLHPRGELRGFYGRGYTDPHDPWQAIAYLEMRLIEGGARAWSPVLRGLCR